MIVKILLVLFQTVLWHCNHLSQGPNPGDGRECHAVVHIKWSPGFAIIPITPRSRARLVLTALGTVSREKKVGTQTQSDHKYSQEDLCDEKQYYQPGKRNRVGKERRRMKHKSTSWIKGHNRSRDSRYMLFYMCHFGSDSYHGMWYRIQARPTVLYRGTTVPTLGAMAKQKLSKGCKKSTV